MRKAALFLAAVALALAAALLYRAWSLPSLQVEAVPVDPLDLDADALARGLGGAIRFRTVSHERAEDREAAPFAALRAYLERTYPRVHDTLGLERISEHTLLYTWDGTAPSLEPIVLLAHQDVVPVEPGTESDWDHSPFSGAFADGYVWGRGALDDKVNVIGILEAAEHLVTRGFRPRRSVLLAFGHDEELWGPEGAGSVARLLEERGIRPAAVFDEGGAVVEGTFPGVGAPVALVGVAEKGSVNVELSVQTQGGHSSTPPPESSIGILAGAVRRLERTPMPARMTPPVRSLLEALAPEATFGYRIVFANLWLLSGVVTRIMGGNPITAPMVRTSTAPTIFHAGIKANVVPGQAEAVVNFRILPGDTVASVLDHVRRTIADDRVVVSPSGRRREPSSVSSVDSDAFRLLARTIREVFPGTVVAPYLVLGGTDARHFRPLTENVYRFMPLRLTEEDTGRLHGTNERVSVEALATAVRFYVRLLTSGAG